MMFSKLSIFIAATLAAFVAEAVPQTNSAKTLSCPSGPVKCCESYFTSATAVFNLFFVGTKKRAATEDDIKLAHDKLNVGITAGTEIWADCFNFDKTWYDCLII